MPNPGLDPPVAFRFAIRMDDAQDSADFVFLEAAGLPAEFSIERRVEGGEDRFKHRLPTTIKRGILVLKRGLGLTSHPLFRWCQQTLQSPLSVAIELKPIQLSLLDDQGQSRKTWRLNKAYPVKWEASELNAKSGEALIESIELAYQSIAID